MSASMKRPDTYPAYAGVADCEMGESKASAAAYDYMRRGFVNKVFGLLAAQLALTVLIAAPMVAVPAVKGFVTANPWLVSLASMGGLVLILVLSFSEHARHSHPTNLLLLAAFTALEGVVVGAVSSTYDTRAVALAAAATAGVAGALSAYAARTKTDYTAQGGALLTALVALIFTGLLGALTRSTALELAIAGGGALLFGWYLVFDVQMLIGGQHTRFQLSPDDYVAGAIALYLDVINLFLYILRLLGNDRE
ncbi:MAG: inhibitor of apoptosis-promoting Bax1-domain-containing protein [Monoraphidium minutum]|nr:MAG: inhibitor of apoptosis-promoting Bax1-domain-containing protein [Monoraphidium minutum]